MHIKCKKMLFVLLLVSSATIADIKPMESIIEGFKEMSLGETYDSRLVILSEKQRDNVINGYNRYKANLSEADDDSLKIYVDLLYTLALNLNKGVLDSVVEYCGFHGNKLDFFDIIFAIRKSEGKEESSSWIDKMKSDMKKSERKNKNTRYISRSRSRSNHGKKSNK